MPTWKKEEATVESFMIFTRPNSSANMAYMVMVVVIVGAGQKGRKVQKNTYVKRMKYLLLHNPWV